MGPPFSTLTVGEVARSAKLFEIARWKDNEWLREGCSFHQPPKRRHERPDGFHHSNGHCTFAGPDAIEPPDVGHADKRRRHSSRAPIAGNSEKNIFGYEASIDTLAAAI